LIAKNGAANTRMSSTASLVAQTLGGHWHSGDLIHLLFFEAALASATLAGYCWPDCVGDFYYRDERRLSALDMG